MNENEVSLFNYSLNSQKTAKLEKELNVILAHRGFTLSTLEVKKMTLERDDILRKNHLIDFSFQTLMTVTKSLGHDGSLNKQELLRRITDYQEIFYYLHTTENEASSDEEILAKIHEVYGFYSGELDFVRGYFEDHPNVKEEMTDD